MDLRRDVTGTAYNDAITGDGAASRLSGGQGTDVLSGAAGDDTLDGGVGADTMLGGLGDDDYYVQHAGDRALEAAGEGQHAKEHRRRNALEAEIGLGLRKRTLRLVLLNRQLVILRS